MELQALPLGTFSLANQAASYYASCKLCSAGYTCKIWRSNKDALNPCSYGVDATDQDENALFFSPLSILMISSIPTTIPFKFIHVLELLHLCILAQLFGVTHQPGCKFHCE
jgi:hypothetical protein